VGVCSAGSFLKEGMATLGVMSHSGIVPVFGHLNPFGDLVKQWAGVTISLPI
jgi:hypothetical protein